MATEHQLDNNEQLILSFFNQYLFQQAKNNIEHLKYFYRTNYTTAGNKFITELLDAIDTYSFDAIGEPLFRTILQKCKKSSTESTKILEDLNNYKKLGKDQIAPNAKYLSDVISASIIGRANSMYSESPSDYIKYIKGANVDISVDTFSSTKFSEIDINSIVADDNDSAIPTNVFFLNKAFSNGGLNRGEIFMVCAEPGVGKTLMSMNLALWFASHGERVLYVTLGDMRMRDFIIRGNSIATGESFARSTSDIGRSYNQIKNLVGDNLEISINQAGVVTADDIIEKTISGGFSVVFIDYDSNAKLDDGVKKDASMYDSFGNFYNKLTKLNLLNILTVVCAQPKIFAYGKIINLSDISESSRKQHICDTIFTISAPNPDCPNHLYVFGMKKCRRGNVGSISYAIRLNNGRFIEIPKNVYEILRIETEEKDYTENDIRIMINNSRGAQIAISGGYNGGSGIGQKRPVQNPFSN